MGVPHETAKSLACQPNSSELARWFDKFVAAREDSGSITRWSLFLQSWPPSKLDVYERHLCNIRQPSLLSGGHSPTKQLQDYLLELHVAPLIGVGTIKCPTI